MSGRPRDRNRSGNRKSSGSRKPTGGRKPAGGKRSGNRSSGRGDDRRSAAGRSDGGQGRRGAGRGARRDDDRWSAPERDRRRDGSGDRARDDGPRRPVKGKRRQFDEDSAPTPEEQRRIDAAARGDEPNDETWVDEGPIRREANRAVARGKGRPAARSSSGRRASQQKADRAAKKATGALELDPKRLRSRLGQAKADRTIQRLGEASAAFAEDRYEDARRIMKPIAGMLPDEPAVRELYGLTLYRLGKWKQAVDELEAFANHSASTEQHPVLADCHRALGNHRRVAELWDELAEQSPAAQLVAEGRIVYAGSLADQGKVLEGISVLEAGALGDRKLKDHHLRMRYVLGDLYERAGDHQAARRYFTSISAADPDFFDVQERLAQV